MTNDDLRWLIEGPYDAREERIEAMAKEALEEVRESANRARVELGLGVMRFPMTDGEYFPAPENAELCGDFQFIVKLDGMIEEVRESAEKAREDVLGISKPPESKISPSRRDWLIQEQLNAAALLSEQMRHRYGLQMNLHAEWV